MKHDGDEAPSKWRTLDALWAVRDAVAPRQGRGAPKLTPQQGRVLLALLLFADEHGECTPGVRRLAKIAGLHPQRTRAVLTELEEGVGPLALEVERGRVDAAGDKDTHCYRLSPRQVGLDETYPAPSAARAGGGSPQDPRVGLTKTQGWVSTRPRGGSPQDHKEDIRADQREDQQEDIGVLTHANDSIEPVLHDGEIAECVRDVTDSFLAGASKRARRAAGAPTVPKQAKERRLPAARPDALARALEEARERARAKDWSGCTPTTLVGLYVYLHEGVYGVVPEELASDWLPALSAARRCLERQFAGNLGQAIAFIRWSWQREKRSRKRNPDSDFRMGWRYQFSQRLFTDYRVAVHK
jgi:hypothetical protein